MRFHSTPESAYNQEITILAIIECVVSVVIYVGIGVYFGTFKYLALAVAFAPLMLFRTDVSANWGLEIYKRWNKISDQEKHTFLNALILFLLVTPLIGTVIRIVATMYWAVRRPLQTLKDTPQNWLRQSFCTDFLHPPEIVPLEALKGDETEIPKFTDMIKVLLEEAWYLRILFILVFSPYIIIGWLPSLIYRVSFKATAIAYAPFIWVAHATLKNPLSAKPRLERITKGELEKVRRGLSYIILTVLLVKLVFVLNWVDRSYVESKFPSQKIVSNFVILDGWAWWQITLAIDALLTFFIFFFADAALARLEGQQTWREDVVMKTVSSVSFLRAALSIATISHFLYIALVAVLPNSASRLLTF